MKAKLNIKMLTGEEIEVTAIVPDFIAWERYSKKRISDLVDRLALEDMAYLAHSALKRQGEKVKPFDGWIGEVEEIGMAEEDPKVTK